LDFAKNSCHKYYCRKQNRKGPAHQPGVLQAAVPVSLCELKNCVS